VVGHGVAINNMSWYLKAASRHEYRTWAMLKLMEFRRLEGRTYNSFHAHDQADHIWILANFSEFMEQMENQKVMGTRE
jgi:hypothetical protein